MIFWGIALLLVLATVMFVITPLLKRNTEQSVADDAAGKRLNNKLAMVLTILVPVMALTTYSQLGAKAELAITALLNNPDSTAEQRVFAMEQWVKKEPENKEALYLLGSEYMSVGLLSDAARIYRSLYAATGPHPQVSAQLAQVMFLSGEQDITVEVRRLYQESLALEPGNNTALGLKGIDAFEQKHYADAANAWRTALNNEKDPRTKQALAAGVVKAEKMLGKVMAKIIVKLDIAPELQSLPADTRVILFARESGTQNVPVIAVPLTIGDLPRDIVLDDSSFMAMRGRLLAELPKLDIFARITVSGDAKSSDYQVAATGVEPSGGKVVELKILAEEGSGLNL